MTCSQELLLSPPFRRLRSEARSGTQELTTLSTMLLALPGSQAPGWTQADFHKLVMEEGGGAKASFPKNSVTQEGV